MNGVATWRGQVPAWECDPDRRWELGFLAGAFAEAARIAGADEAAIRAIEGQRPVAGALVEIRTERRGEVLHHTMVDLSDGVAFARASGPGRGPLPSVAASMTGDASRAATLDLVRGRESDVMGHMNVQFYAQRVTAAEAMALGAAGRADARIVRPLEHRYRFAGELKAGDAAASRVSLTGRGAETLRVKIAAGDGRPAAVVESDLAGADRAPVDLSDRFQPPAQAIADPVWSAGDWFPGATDREHMAILSRAEVAAWQVDHTGIMPPRFFFDRMAGGVPFLLAGMGLDRPYMLRHGLGRAAVGYRLRYLRWPRAGDCLELRSGIGLVRDKTWRFRHVFINLADGEAVCSAEAVIVLLDLYTRRAVPLPAEIRDRASALEI